MDEQPTSQEKLKAILEKATGVSASLFRNGVISDTLHEATIMQVMAAISMSHPGLTTDQLVKIRTTVESMATRSSHADMLQAADAIAREYILENDEKMQSQTPQQMTDQLWTDYQTRDKENADEFEKLYHNGVITSEQMHYLRHERARLDALPLESVEWLNGEIAFVEYQNSLSLHISEYAHTQGDAGIMLSANKVMQNTEVQKQELDEIKAIGIGLEQGKITKSANDNIFIKEESIMESGLSKMQFLDVTHLDVQSPPLSKERFTSKGKV